MPLPNPLPCQEPDAIPLPPSAQAVAEVIGREATLRLAKAAKHRAVYVPHVIRPGHWLHMVLGEDNARALAREFCGIQLPLAQCKVIDLADRNWRAVQAIRKGKAIGTVAQELGLSYERVRQLWRDRNGNKRKDRVVVEAVPTTSPRDGQNLPTPPRGALGPSGGGLAGERKYPCTPLAPKKNQ